METIVFSDIDGTLLNDHHQITPLTMQALYTLKIKNIPFVIVSARSPSGIYPIIEKNNIYCDIICYSGGLILDHNRTIIYNQGFSKDYASQIITYLENNKMDCTWNIYSLDQWIVKDKSDPRVIHEERIVEALSTQGSLENIQNDVNKILLMCNPKSILSIQSKLQDLFDNVTISQSSDILLEINAKGVNKAYAIKKLCEIKQIDIKKSIAFGDQFNDEEMLKCAGYPFLMDNAPDELKKIIKNHTQSNNEDGIYYALKKLNII